MKVNFPMNSLEGKAWLGLGAPGKAEWLPSCLGGQDGQWPKVVEGWVLKRMVRKRNLGLSFEPLADWTVLSCTGLAKPTDLEVPPLRHQDGSVKILTLA